MKMKIHCIKFCMKQLLNKAVLRGDPYTLPSSLRCSGKNWDKAGDLLRKSPLVAMWGCKRWSAVTGDQVRKVLASKSLPLYPLRGARSLLPLMNPAVKGSTRQRLVATRELQKSRNTAKTLPLRLRPTKPT